MKTINCPHCEEVFPTWKTEPLIQCENCGGFIHDDPFPVKVGERRCELVPMEAA